MSIHNYPPVSKELAHALLPRAVRILPGWYDDGNHLCKATYAREEVEGWIDAGLAHAVVVNRMVTALIFEHPVDHYHRRVFVQNEPRLYTDNTYVLIIKDIVE